MANGASDATAQPYNAVTINCYSSRTGKRARQNRKKPRLASSRGNERLCRVANKKTALSRAKPMLCEDRTKMWLYVRSKGGVPDTARSSQPLTGTSSIPGIESGTLFSTEKLNVAGWT